MSVSIVFHQSLVHLVKLRVELSDLSLEILVLLLEVADGEVDHIEHLHPGAPRLGLIGPLDGSSVIDVEVLVHGNLELLQRISSRDMRNIFLDFCRHERKNVFGFLINISRLNIYYTSGPRTLKLIQTNLQNNNSLQPLACP